MSIYEQEGQDFRDSNGFCRSCSVEPGMPHKDTCLREFMHVQKEHEEQEEEVSRVFQRGGGFFQNVPKTPPAVWGMASEVMWAEGEALMIAAPQGTGKTTIAHQLIRARIGLQDEVLGMPVAPGSRVLYLAMDRPSQARRAGARIFAGDDPAYLDDRIVVWEGPPPFDLAKRPEILAAMCAKAKADTVVVDSLKDAAIGLSEDETGAGWNRARQTALRDGVQVLELHHMRKAGSNGAVPNTISDIYGSTWLTSGAGSVMLLWGDPGDPVVQMRHLKQPMDEIGPFSLTHDHVTGVTTVQQGADLFELIRRSGADGVTADQAAVVMFDTRTPTRAQKEKARRKLNKMCDEGKLVSFEGTKGGKPTTYFLGPNGWS